MIGLKVFSMQLACGERPTQHAVMRITLDLDGGVKVNCGKFGDFWTV